ncbi:MAG: Riboflavin kinase [Cenarchaeum symbiont of Oopsacas minuta]|nr:Riboflavin kinase [Cenarchaeum symbiont of Oopsacas minuta]
MAELNTHHLLSLAHLLSMGAGSNFVRVTTESLGKAIGRSQQAASTHLAKLEDVGYVERTIRGGKTYVMVTKKGATKVRQISATISKSLAPKNNSGRILWGKMSSGIGEGAYYMSLEGYVEQFRKKIGYVPYPGTLNVKLDDRSSMATLDMVTSEESDALIDGFSDGKRTYGWVKCYECILGGKKCHLIRLERTHHDDGLVEVISKMNLRRACKLYDGSMVEILIPSRKN